MNWFKKAKCSAIDMLPPDAFDIRENEEGRSARGMASCPKCKTVCTVTSCSDVGGVWWYCPKCGLVDK